MEKIRRLLAVFIALGFTAEAGAAVLDEHCVVNILNRTVQVSPDGTWDMPNVPSTMGNVRARVTCIRDGVTTSGATPFFTIRTNKRTLVPDFVFAEDGEAAEPVKAPEIMFAFDESLYLYDTTPFPLKIFKQTDEYFVETLNETELSGLNVSSSNRNIVSYVNGNLVAVKSGKALVTARLDGSTIVKEVVVQLEGTDSDGDGLPDEFELENGLDPNDRIDAFEDRDGDGLNALEEYNLGTDLNDADSDGDGISDGEEATVGEDGVITNPLASDSDGDGLNDVVEILVGSDPNDNTDANFDDALIAVAVSPPSVEMTFNGIDSEVSTQLSVTGTLIDGSSLDLTATASGTKYTSSDATIVSFGLEDGLIFGGQPGNAVVTVSNRSLTVNVNVLVKAFTASALSAVVIPGYANNVDVAGDYAYVAAGAAGLQVVNVSDRTNPQVVAGLDTDGVAIDVKVVGELAYVADGESGLKIIDISDPLVPSLVGQYDGAGVSQDLAVDISHAYLANGRTGIEIIDVSKPSEPVRVAAVPNLGQVVGIDVENDRLVVAADSGVIVFDVADRASPVRLGSVNIGSVKDLVLDGNYVHVAAYSSGYRVVDISNPILPRITGGDASIAPRDVALTRNFAFYSEQLFPNVVAFVNIFNPENPVFQGTINLSPFGDYAGTGIALDAGYAYITEERYVVSSDYKATGDTKLFIAQYRDLNDNNGVAPTVDIRAPLDGQVVVEGHRFIVDVEANDDVAVAQVRFSIGGEVVFVDTTSPYQFAMNAPDQTDTVSIDVDAVDLGGNVSDTASVLVVIQPDSDKDGLGDQEELVSYGTDPENPDSDGDGLLDGKEVSLGTNPLATDSDGDGLSDQAEVTAGTDPLNPDITPPEVQSVTPATDATDIPENQAISVVFNEPLQARSVTPDVLTVVDDLNNPVSGNLKLISNNTELLFTPDGLMKDFTLHTISVSGVRDSAGNPLAATFTSSFTTGNLIDTVKPTVAIINPVNAATGVPVNAVVTAIMSEPIDPTTVTADSFYLLDQSTNQRIEGVISVSEDKTAISFVANAVFLVGRQHRIILTSGIKDLFGNSMNYRSYYFTTNFEPDGQAPQVVRTSIADGATQVPMNGKLNVLFSETVNALYLDKIRLFDSVGNEVALQRQLQNNRRLVNLTPVSALQANQAYQWIIDGVRDLSGNLLPNAVIINFDTSAVTDGQAGNVTGFSIPNNNTQGVPLNAELEVTFSERIDPTSVNDNSFYLYDNTINRRVAGSWSLSSDGRTLRFHPSASLEAHRQYYFYVSWNSRLSDLAGNQINGNYRYFTTGDSADATAPAVVQSSFADGATAVPLNGRLVVRLSEPLGAQCAVVDGVSLSSGGEAVAVNVSLDNDRRTLVITPTADLTGLTGYQLDLAGLCDYAGNSLAAVSLAFTTGTSSDSSGPTLVSMTPAHGSGEVGVNSTVVLTFNETIDALTAPVIRGAGVVVSGSYAVSGDSVTFTPDVSLKGNTTYQVELYSNVRDLAGNSRYLGSRNFTTEALSDVVAPAVAAISPQASAVDVSPLSDVVVTFSESMNLNSLNDDNIAFYVNGSVIRPSLFRSADGRRLSLRGNLPSASVVSVVMTDGVRDLSGNPLAPYVSSFTTGVVNYDNSRPRISRQVPGDGSGGWLDLNEIVLHADDTMAVASIDAAFHVAENGVLVDGQVEVLNGGRTIRFTKATPFAEGALVQVYLESSATDEAGNAFYDYSGHFNMGSRNALVGNRPYPSGYFPTGNMTGVVLNPVIYVRYNEEMDVSSLNSSNVALRRASDNGVVASSVSLDDSGRLVQVRPDAPLAADTRYYLALSGNILDTDGDRQNYYYSTYFTTGADAVSDDRQPVVLSMSPPSGSSGVGVNAHYAVRFDERMNSLSFDAVKGERYNAQFSQDYRVVTYDRLGTLLANSEVTETVPALLDTAGNVVVSRSTTFTTGAGPDLNRPALVDSNIPNGQQDVAINLVPEWVFNEAMNPISVTASGVYLYDTADGARVPASLALSEDGKRLQIVPNAALAPGRQYNYYAYNLRDLSGNNLSNTSRYFTTGFASDEAAPVVRSSTVYEGQTGVPRNVRLDVRYSEPLSGLAPATVSLVDGGGSAVMVNISLSGDRRTLTVVPRQLLAADSAYTLSIDGVQDLSGNSPAAAFGVNFVTGNNADFRDGSVTGFSIPNNNTQGVPLNAELEAAFNDRIDPTSVNDNSFYLYDNTANQRVAGSWSLSSDGRSLRFHPSASLEANRQYYLYVSWNSRLSDLAGNQINGSYRYFTTGDSADATAPAVVQSSFADGATAVPLNGRLVVRLSERLGGQCPVTAGVSLSSGGEAVAVNVSLESDRRTLVITPTAELAPGSIHNFALNGLCDYAGNVMTAFALSFTTGFGSDSVAPSLVDSVPANGDVDVATDAVIILNFSEQIDLVALLGQVTLDNAAPAGTFVSNGATVTFFPAEPFVSGTSHSFRINYVYDLVGNRRYLGQTISFTVQ